MQIFLCPFHFECFLCRGGNAIATLYIYCNGSAAANLFSQTTENNYKMLEFFLSIRFIYVLYAAVSKCISTAWNSGVQSAANRQPNVTWFQCVFMFDFPLGFHSSDHCKWPRCGFNFDAKRNLNFAHTTYTRILYGVCVYSSLVHSSENFSVLSHVSSAASIAISCHSVFFIDAAAAAAATAFE